MTRRRMSPGTRAGVVLCTVAAATTAVWDSSGVIRTTGVLAQTQDAPQQPAFRSGATFVSVDVHPRRDGRPVDDLTASDFQVFEDGKPQTIETFELVRVAAGGRESGAGDFDSTEAGDRLAADPRRRVFVVYRDLYHTTRTASTYGSRALLDFLRRSLAASDLVGAMTTDDPVSRLVFRRNADQLERDLIMHPAWGRADEAGERVVLHSTTEEQVATCDPLQHEDLLRLYREDGFFTSLENLIVRLGALREERKNLLLIAEAWSPRSGTYTPRGQPAVSVAWGPDGLRRRSNQTSAWCRDLVRRLANIDFAQRFLDLLRRAGTANVSIYPVDVGGLRRSLPMADASTRTIGTPHTGVDRAHNTFRLLAEHTGGMAVLDSNDLAGGLRAVAADLGSYYLLGYSSRAAADGRFHAIDVKIARPGVTVSARRGYYASVPRPMRLAAETTAPAARDRLLEDEFGQLARIREGTQLFGHGLASRSELLVVAELAPEAISRRWPDGADVVVSAANPAGRFVTARGRVEAGARSALVRLPAAASDGPWHLKLQITDVDGTVEERFSVTAAEATLVGDPVLFRGLPAPRAPLQPVADRRLRRTERLQIEWPVFDRPENRRVRLLNRRGDSLPLDLSVVDRTDLAQPLLTTSLPLASLAPGDYVIELVATRGSAAERRLFAFRLIR